MSQTDWETIKQLLVARKKALTKKRTVHVWGPSQDIEEINSGAIVPSGIYGEYQIQANTAGGLRNVRAVESTDSDLQSDIEDASAIVLADAAVLLSEIVNRWKSVPVNVSVKMKSGKADVVIADPPFSKLDDVGHVEDVTTPGDVLQQLRNPAISVGGARKAVLNAEVLSFTGDERTEICSLLRDFVLRYRDSNVPQDLVAVGAATRKLVAYLPSEDLGTLAELLKPGARVSIPIEVELEVAKTVVRKLSAHPPVSDDPEPELADRLFEVAETYLNPRLLPRERHGATALNAILSLLLLRSGHVSEVIELVRDTDATWFIQLTCRRVTRLVTDLRRRVPEPAFDTVSRSLMEFSKSFGDENE